MVDLKKKDKMTGKELKEFRMSVMDMTQEDFAKLLGTSVSTVRTWEQTDASVPRYINNMIHIIAANPRQALSALNTEVGISGDGNPRWDHVPEHMYSVDAHNRAMAIDRIKGSPWMSRCMELIDDTAEFAKLLQNMGDKYRRFSTTDILLMRMMVMLEKTL